MKALHEVLLARREEVMLRWRTMVQGTIAPESMPTPELVDHFPLFLREVIGALRVQAGLPSTMEPPETSATAADHGEQRLRLGFSLDAVVREYGALRDAIVVTAQDAQVPISFGELQSIFDSTLVGIASAVSEYGRQRDAELHRQHNEHIAFIAHELRNPLMTAMTAIELLRLPGDSRPGQALTRSLERMRELINHSLQMARSASGVELRREPIRLAKLLADAELVASPEAEANRIGIRVIVTDDAELNIDVRLISSALNNLVRNAVKYSCSSGQVDLRARIDGPRVTIEVEDTCGGLPEAAVLDAFAPFVRLGNDDKTGFGLGLAIAKQAVDAHGGSIRVQNLPGKGCIFALELPIAPEH
ncbi:MAG: sensor histidine kinase [Deltaproteobacteria bacterium]|nr:sensor histidine kinase [Deltaproteobacteria bacterium]